MTEANDNIKSGDLVLVQPMRYCISFTKGGLEGLMHEPGSPMIITHHWSEDGFKARVLRCETVATLCGEGNQQNVEEYLEVKIFGKGRKHFTKRNNEKTKVVWVQKRLVSKCKDDKKKK